MVTDQLTEILEIENDPAFLELKCPFTGVVAWPALRNDVLRLLLGDRLYTTTPILLLEPTASAGRVLAGAARAAVYNATHRQQPAEVLIIGSGAGLLPRKGALYNRLTDDFAGALGERAWTMEGLLGDRWPKAPRLNRRLSFLAVDRLVLAGKTRTNVHRTSQLLASQLVDLVVDRGRDILGWIIGDARRARLRAIGARRLTAYPLRARLAEKVLDRTAARTVLLEDACFGQHAVFNAIARERGVEVAEFQHGMITSNHDAYNVHGSLRDGPAYQRTLPRTMLTYGERWNSEFNMPIDRIAIGNPSRSELLQTWRPATIRDRLIVLGDGVETTLFLDLCRRIASVVSPSHPVSFRPHPRERASVALLRTEGFSIDLEPDLYTSLASAAIVIGDSSTAIFEAVGLGTRVFVWDTDKSRFYLGAHPFARFGSASELADALATPNTGEIDPQLSAGLWSENWRERFLGYIAGRTVSSSTRGAQRT